jgi:gliding motility-associated-like protein
VTGSCFTNPFRFTDTTRTNYGAVDSWTWDFGDLTTLADTSHIQNPSWTFATPGSKTARLVVTNSKGCVASKDVTFDVFDKPQITLAFRDTLICRNDAVQLNASGTGVWSWTPLFNISNPNSPNPTVNPPTTRWYYVKLNDQGCINTDSVQVRVVANVTLQARGDTTICLTDAVQLDANSDGLQFSWTPSSTLNDPNIRNPIATPDQALTRYTVTATIGSCSAVDFVDISTVPYPLALAGPDDTVCYNTSTQLNASHDGSSFSWSPITYLSNPNILNPIVTAPRTTQYVFTVYDTVGCPKPGRDTIIVYVSPKLSPFAGRDTTVVINQPLQFNATGGVSYLWIPSTGLNNPNISNPVGIYGPEIDTIRYKVIIWNAIGCPDSAYVTVRVFKTFPTIFVPTAFTPNGDGLNDVIRPIAVGIKKINSFNIYNRWGQLVFSTTVNGLGWDGRIAGKPQGSAVFVWTVSAVDYLDRKYNAKGTVTLIR